MKPLPCFCAFLVAASLGAEDLPPLTEPQQAFVAVVKREIVEYAVREAVQENDLDRAAEIKAAGQNGTVGKGLVITSWPFTLGSASLKPGKARDPEPPVARQSFTDLLPTLAPTVEDIKTHRTVKRTPEAFYVQFSRCVGALQEIEGRGAPYALAATLPAAEADRVAKALQAALPVDDLPQWRRAVPLALAGLVTVMDGAEKGLESSLLAYLKAVPGFRPGFGHRPATREETIILGLGAIKVKLGKTPARTAARFQVLRSGLEGLEAKLKELAAP